MPEQFSHVAAKYDHAFTHTAIGKHQRKQVLSALSAMLKPNQVSLELNCGTGEDAVWLGQRVKSVLATDISLQMVEAAKKKILACKNVSSATLDINQIGLLAPQTFDLIFSNFGGLNCLSPQQLQAFFLEAAKRLNKGGSLVLVIMGKKTLWERLYYTLKGDKQKAKRRNTTSSLQVNVGGQEVKTWYYSPSDVMGMSELHYQSKAVKPIGFFVPPSYLETFFRNKKVPLMALSWLDRICPPGLANYADHFYIHLQKKAS